MKQIIQNPKDGIYAATPDYVHAIEVQQPSRWLYIAGTMGLDETGGAPDTLDEQLDLIWRNIRRILVEAEMTTDNIVRITSYLTDVTHAEANGAARVKALGKRRVPTTAIIVQTLDPKWLVEIEAIAVA